VAEKQDGPLSGEDLREDGGVLQPEQGGGVAVERCRKDGEAGYRAMPGGRCITGPNAKRRAEAVAAAMRAKADLALADVEDAVLGLTDEQIELLWPAAKQDLTPRSGESTDDFVSRCIEAEVEAGRPQDQAAAICFDKARRAGRDAPEKSAAERRDADNFFVIEDGVAKDLGNDRPEGAKPLGDREVIFALISEKGGSNTARSLGDVSRSEALETAANAADRDPNAKVFVGKAVGRFEGQTLFQDIAQFRGEKKDEPSDDRLHPRWIEKSDWIKKADEELQIVWGEVYVPDFPDSQGDMMSAQEVRKIAHKFLADGRTRQIDVNHDNQVRKGCAVVESFVARPGDPDFIAGAWVAGVHVGDRGLWEAIKAGDFNGFSMQARVMVTEKIVELDLPVDIEGETEEALDDGGGGLHAHRFTVRIDEDGQIAGGRTSVELGHWHSILRGSVTSTSIAEGQVAPRDGTHRHRYSFLDRLFPDLAPRVSDADLDPPIESTEGEEVAG